jgi:hypothetical protein
MKVKQISEQYETHWLDGLPLKGVIAMQDNEIRFINGIIRELKPKKLLEVGVHRGGSSMLMLNGIKDDSSARLYSVEYAREIEYGVTFGVGMKNYQQPDDNKKIGWAVYELTPELTSQWVLYAGGHIAEFIEKIAEAGGGGGVELCLIDAAHQLPGEILDFLVILPYMSKDGIIIQHDAVLDHNSYTNLYASPLFNLTCIAQPILFSVMRSEKWKPLEFDVDIYPTADIGAHQITDDTWRFIDDAFWALNLKWRYLPTEKDMEHIVKVLEKHYDRKNIDMFLRNYELNKKVGVDKNPYTAPVAASVKKSTPEAQLNAALTRRMQRLEKLSYAGFAGIAGFLSASALAILIAALRH